MRFSLSVTNSRSYVVVSQEGTEFLLEVHFIQVVDAILPSPVALYDVRQVLDIYVLRSDSSIIDAYGEGAPTLLQRRHCLSVDGRCC